MGVRVSKVETSQIRLCKQDGALMFTPRIAAAQSNTAESPAKGNARQRPEPIRRNLGLNAAERVQMLQRTIGNQAVSRLLRQEVAQQIGLLTRAQDLALRGVLPVYPYFRPAKQSNSDSNGE
jgi:hypothetical protein